uniref:Uncharacterized protein n=1 Tax=Hemiselmis andersenii TaxID=464988 RepID=A0A6U2HYN6_HEMAN|mmetsp:Transcript_42814/g.99417  ORF Transcript_42814/g.99417 Transcript_42814/m.99417 type:complete len:356 (+) Transcript_42814:238-1305(+)
MERVTNLLKGRLDTFAEPHIDETSQSIVGGILTILWYLAAAAWTAYYVVGCVSTGQLLTTQTSFAPFTEDPTKTMMFPPMRCVSPGGCWVHNMNVTGGDSAGELEGIVCYYVRDGQDLPPFTRRVFLTSDPVEGFSVTFNASKSFFSVSYDQVRVSDLRTGANETSLRGSLEDRSPKIYQGSALMQLTQVSSDSSVSGYTVDEWASVTTSTFGGVTAPWNLCCKAQEVGLVGSDGKVTVTTDPEFTLAGRRCDKKGISQTTLTPFPTINKVKVQDWIAEGLSQFGGISSTCTLLALFVIWFFRKMGDRSARGHQVGEHPPTGPPKAPQPPEAMVVTVGGGGATGYPLEMGTHGRP